MKKILFFCLFVIVSLLACTAKETDNEKKNGFSVNATDSIVYGNLGKTIYEVFASPSKVSVMFLKAKENITPDDVVIEKPFVEDSMIQEKLSKSEIAILQYLLPFDSENYHIDSVQVRSPYLPVIDFVFTKKKNKVHLLVSLQDFTWTVVYDGKTQFHWNYADRRQISRFCKQFLSTK